MTNCQIQISWFLKSPTDLDEHCNDVANPGSAGPGLCTSVFKMQPVDFHQTYINISLGPAFKMIRFCDLDLVFKVMLT